MPVSQQVIELDVHLDGILIEAKKIVELFSTDQKIDRVNNATVVFWGIGNRFEKILEFWGNQEFINPAYAVDSTRNLDQNLIRDIRIEPFEEIYKNNPNLTTIVITAGLLDLQAKIVNKELYYYRVVHIRSIEMATYLIRNLNQFKYTLDKLNSFESKKLYLEVLSNIITGRFFDPSLYSPDSYFGNKFIEKLEAGTIVFAGAFNGKHISRFIGPNGSIDILAFEPNPNWYNSTREKFSREKRVYLKNALLGSVESQVFFDPDTENHGLSARIEDKKSDKTIDLDVSKLDNEFYSMDSLGPVSQIILDVEGVEPDALIGASEIIRNFRPKLSICIYHNPHDFSNLIRIVEEICPNQYKYEILQHSCISSIETVMYCIPLES